MTSKPGDVRSLQAYMRNWSIASRRNLLTQRQELICQVRRVSRFRKNTDSAPAQMMPIERLPQGEDAEEEWG
jgi:hypothetical protein